MTKHLPMDKIAKMYSSGYLVKDLANKYSVSVAGLIIKLRNSGVEMRTRSESNRLACADGYGFQRTKYYAIDDSEILDLYVSEHWMPYKIAERAGCNSADIKHILDRMGVRRKGGKGENSAKWKGGICHHGPYIMIKCPNHPNANNRGYVNEHQLVWEKEHKQLLPRGWVIHHLHGIKDDNRPENMMACPKLKHDRLIPILLAKIKELGGDITPDGIQI